MTSTGKPPWQLEHLDSQSRNFLHHSTMGSDVVIRKVWKKQGRVGAEACGPVVSASMIATLHHRTFGVEALACSVDITDWDSELLLAVKGEDASFRTRQAV